MLDAALRLTFRNLTTLFLVVAVVTVPLHVGYALVFRDVISVRSIHEDIEDFPEARLVGGVGAADLRAARRTLLLIGVLELALAPLFYRATRRVLEDDREGRLPTVWRALLGAVRPMGARPPHGSAWATLVGGLLLAVTVWFLARTTGLLIAGLLPDPAGYVVAALAEGSARALGAPFFLVSAVVCLHGAKGAGGSEPTQ